MKADTLRAPQKAHFNTGGVPNHISGDKKMSILRKSYVCQIALGLAILAAPSAMFAISNPDCTLIAPAHPLSAAGLATPYQLVATDPTHGACHETNSTQSA